MDTSNMTLEEIMLAHFEKNLDLMYNGEHWTFLEGSKFNYDGKLFDYDNYKKEMIDVYKKYMFGKK